MNQLMYREHLIEHYKNPQNYGHIDNPDFKNKEDNPLCGDEIEIEVKFSTAKERGSTKSKVTTSKVPKIKVTKIKDIKFSGHGCAISQAAASLMTEHMKGKNIEDIKKFSREEMLGLLKVEVTPMRLKCALLAWNVLQNGLRDDKNIRNVPQQEIKPHLRNKKDND